MLPTSEGVGFRSPVPAPLLDISRLNPIDVIVALYTNADGSRMTHINQVSVIQTSPDHATMEGLATIIYGAGVRYFEWLDLGFGPRPLFMRLDQKCLDTNGYDRCNAKSACSVLEPLYYAPTIQNAATLTAYRCRQSLAAIGYKLANRAGSSKSSNEGARELIRPF